MAKEGNPCPRCQDSRNIVKLHEKTGVRQFRDDSMVTEEVASDHKEGDRGKALHRKFFLTPFS